jgi:aminoglycoside phosphotransferase (APT) family kinase protein
VPLQPVLRDLRAENLLFDAGDVSGVIDWDAAAVDHPCLDAARLLRTWHLNHTGQMAAAALAWANHWQLSNEQRLLLIVLDASGVLLNPVVWFRRLSEASSVPDAVPEVGQRLRLLMSAAEVWQPLQL